MIKIQVSENKMKEIEKKHLEWFGKTSKGKLKTYIEKGTYKIKSNDKGKKKIPEQIYKLLELLNDDEILKSILVGKLTIRTEKYNSLDNIIEQIKCQFNSLFDNLIENSISEFLKQIKLELENIRDKSISVEEKNSELKYIKNDMKQFFNTEKEVVKLIYKYDYINIVKKIDNIKIIHKRIQKFNELRNLFKKNDNQINKALKIILNNIFNYNNFISGDGKNNSNYWGAYELLKELNITTCPYCNRQYINTYISETGKTRADIDHFYPKSKYPFLAVSLYNFIPSCHTCNSSFKGSIDFYKNKTVYPYEEEFGEDAKFETSFYTEKDTKDRNYDIRYLLGNSDNFKIEIKPKEAESDMGKKIQNSIDTFHLEALYNFHKDYVRELIKKAIIYNESRVDELYNQYTELFSSREEVVQMVVSNYINEEYLGKRPLSKLTKDICEELGLR